jgi:glycosyltransferase involved in cell wall biosynthesis
MDLARGAQVYARALCNHLDSADETHRTLTIFETPPAGLYPDETLGVPAGRWRQAGLDPRAVIRLRRRLRSSTPTVLVVHGGEPLKYAAITSPRSVPVVYYRIGTTAPAIRNAAQRRLHRSLARRAAAIACVSDDVATEAVDLLGVPPTRLSVIPNGRDPAVFSPRHPDAAGDQVTLGFIGRLNPDKRPEWFLDIVGTLRQEGLAVRGVCVGDGPLAAGIASRAATAGVKLLGRRQDVPALLRQIDVLLLPSRPPEGMPGVLIEAGLSGVPAVVTDTPGVRNVVCSGITGLVVGVHQRDEMVSATRTLVVDARLRAKMGQAARDRCCERFSIEASARAWRALLAGI